MHRPGSDGRLAVLSGGLHHCQPSFRQGRCAARRPAVPDRRVRRGPVCARPDARPADHPGRRGPGTAPEDLSPARSPAVLARPAPSRSSPASREPIPRSTARCRRDLAAPDLPAEAGPRPVRHVSEDGRPLHSIGEPCIYRLAESSAADLQAILAGPPGEPIPSTRHASPRPYPHAPHSLLTMDPAAPPHRGRSGHRCHLGAALTPTFITHSMSPNIRRSKTSHRRLAYWAGRFQNKEIR